MSSQYLYQCLTGRRDMDAADAVRVELLTGGAIQRTELRRDWILIWPERAELHPTCKKVEVRHAA